MGAAIKPIPSKETPVPRYPVIWLDSSVNTSQENIDGQRSIRSSIDHLKTFDKVDLCEEHLGSLAPEERIILIVSGRLGREIIPRIHHLRQVSLIYVYCLDRAANEPWATQYKKVGHINHDRKRDFPCLGKRNCD